MTMMTTTRVSTGDDEDDHDYDGDGDEGDDDSVSRKTYTFIRIQHIHRPTKWQPVPRRKMSSCVRDGVAQSKQDRDD